MDTSSPAVGAAVLRGDDVVGVRQTIDARRHGELLAPCIEGALQDAGVALRDIDGRELFRLFETYGLPPELTLEELGVTLDWREDFDRAASEHRESSRSR